ncbi:MAG: NUDIX hydrolase [Clostridiales bacterium]|nr:NUDIX hydrolase [Clostridiales bacterium]
MDYFEKTLKSDTVYDGKILRLDVETVLLPNDNTATREIVRHPGAVAILPVTKDGEIYFVRQYRKALDMELLEVPAGKLEKDEVPYECAMRELQEEIGFAADKLTLLGSFYSSPGFSNEIIYVYKAEDLTPSQLTPDEDEFINVVKLDIKESLKMLNKGLIRDSKTAIALSLGLLM